MDYYSARLLVVILVDDGRPKKKNHYDEQVILFKAADYEHAFARALEIGKKQETVQKNRKDQAIKWTLVKVEAIRLIGQQLDGVEVMSKLSYTTTKAPIPFDHEFKPEQQDPCLE